MDSAWKRMVRLVGPAAMVVALAPPVGAAGFDSFEQGSKAMGGAMAFTAQADDPSAMFYNVGGLGLFDEREFYAGLTLISFGDTDFRGGLPFPGTTERGTHKDQLALPPHFYWVEPLGDRVRFGLSITSPFRLQNEWDAADVWTGRFISENAEVTTLDLTPNVGFRFGEKLGIGVGLVVRTSDLELVRREAEVDPFDGMAKDVASIKLSSDTDTGVGLNIGVLHRTTDFFSWGFSYRSAIEIDYSVDGRLTQIETGNPVFDAIISTQFPFDQNLPVKTSIEFPDQASLGLGFQCTTKWLFEIDFNWTGWSSFDEFALDFTTDPSFDSTRVTDWDDTVSVRGGVAWDFSDRATWRFGLYFDESPQPTEDVGPFIADADRVGFTLGYGLTSEKLTFDIALQYVAFDDRTVTFPDGTDNFYGTYKTNRVSLGLSFGF